MVLDHYSSVVQLWDLMHLEKYEELEINHNADVDCKGKKCGKWLALEYEIKGSHTTEQLLEKKATAIDKGYEIRFVCSSTDYPFISAAVGPDYCIQRGQAVTDFIHTFGNQSTPEAETQVLAGYPDMIAEMEALEAPI